MSGVTASNESGMGVPVGLLVAQADHMLARLRIDPESELSISLVGESEMAELNARWMDHTGPTDVLSFPMDEMRQPESDQDLATGVLGDIVICPQVAAAQAAPGEAGFASEIELLLTHGILHLLGHDHAEPEEHAAMFALQDELLADWRRCTDGPN